MGPVAAAFHGDGGARERGVGPERAQQLVVAAARFMPGTREFFTCLAGRVTIFVVGDRYDLGVGDVLGFPGNVAHSYQNPDGGERAAGISTVVLAKAGV